MAAANNQEDGAAASSSSCLWPVDDLNRLRRVLCVESDVYSCDGTLVTQHMDCLYSLIDKGQGIKAVTEIEEFSKNGRTVKQQPLLLALAICARSKDLQTKQAAYRVLPEICRIPTYLFLFVKFVEDLGKVTANNSSTGWGRALRRAVSSWYLTKDPKQLAVFVTKYQQRNGWSHKDLLRLSHTNPKDNQAIALVLKFVIRGWKKTKEDYVEDGLSDELKWLLRYLDAVEMVKHASIEEGQKVAALIEEYKLVREHVPTWLLKSKEVAYIPTTLRRLKWAPSIFQRSRIFRLHSKSATLVWKALLQNMPMEALIRSLNRLSSIGLLYSDSNDNCVQLVVGRLEDSKLIQESRLHPMNVLLALESYKKGSGEKGRKLKWLPNPHVVQALDKAFYAAFKNVEATGKHYLLCVDVSRSMDFGSKHSTSQLAPVVAAVSMAMVIARTEPHYMMVAFSSNGLTPVNITSNMTIEEVCKTFSEVKRGSKDCAAPMLWALENKKDVDAFILYTDDKSWAMNTSPVTALRKYRTEMNKEHARLVICSMSASKLTMADPEDAGMLDIAGFDLAVPQIVHNFVMGWL